MKMVTIWQIILAIVIVGLSIIMQIYYYYKKKKNLKKEVKSLENAQIKDYIHKINEKTRNKIK